MPNGTIWMKDRTQVRGVLLGKDIPLGPDVQVTLDSSFTGSRRTGAEARGRENAKGAMNCAPTTSADVLSINLPGPL